MSPLDVLTLLLCAAPAVGLVLLWRAERKSGPRLVEPLTLDCGCAARGATFGCLHCDLRRCGFHSHHKHVCPGRPDRDGDLIAADSPTIVAGEDASRAMRAQAALDFAAITAELSDLNDLDALAEFYLLPEVTQ